MKLYFAPGACSQAVHIALREAGESPSLEKVDLRSRKTASGEAWDELNPKGYVPLLVLDDGRHLTEVAALLQYVGDRNPGAGLIPPAGSPERYQLVEWLTFISAELHKALSNNFNPTLPDDVKRGFNERAKKRLQFVADGLGAKPYLMGDRPSVADAYLFVMLRWAKGFKVEVPPALERYLDRMLQRPAVREALAAEGLS